METILKELISCADEGYRAFHARLIPTVDRDLVLGVRSPIAQKIAKKYANTDTGARFLSSLPHKYYDENITHAFMLGNLNCDYTELKAHLIRFLPYVDNWAVCDGLCAHLKSFFKDKERSLPFVKSCIDLSVYGDIPKCFLSPLSSTYTIRFGLVCLLSYYIEGKYLDEIFKICKDISPLCAKKPTPASYSYYVSMALAWLVSFCLIKEYSRTLPLIESRELNGWVHNKAIQKAIESYQITSDQKTYLRSLKIK